MKAPYLGKHWLGWCHLCNIPLLSEKCDICGNSAFYIELTPPAESKPAFSWEINHINKLSKEIFGKSLLDTDKIAILNKISGFDTGYEIIQDGFKLGLFIYDDKEYLKLYPAGASKISGKKGKKWVKIHPGIAKFLEKGDLLVPGVDEADTSIRAGDEVYIIANQVVAVGSAKIDYNKLKTVKRGVFVKIRHYGSVKYLSRKKSDWDTAIEGNRSYLDLIEKKAITFIKNIVKNTRRHPIVAYSGGKDSLTTLILVKKAIKDFDVMYIDTGIEYPETAENVDNIIKQMGLKEKFHILSAGNSFWDNIDKFGPPAKDFRWCCKVCKLGPVSKGIKKQWKQSITFGGERKYESFSRAKRPKIDKNPWIPNQISAYPILHWRSIEVWLYLFREKAAFNKLYELGYERVGCFLCPASSDWEFKQMRDTHPELYKKWSSYLKKFADKLGLDKDWIKNKWKLMKYRKSEQQKIRYNIISEVSPCKSEESSNIKGIFIGVKPEDFKKIDKYHLIAPIGELKRLNPLMIYIKGNHSFHLFNSGKFRIRGKNLNEKIAYQLLNKLKKIIIRSRSCTGCGLCISSCPQDAISYIDKHLYIDPQHCTNCGACLEQKCPLDIRL